MQTNVERLLYADGSGEVVGLDEVQLLDPVPAARIPALRQLLDGDDPFLAYQAALVLAAWGDDCGLDRVEELINRRAGEQSEFAPDRTTGADNIYDELAYAVHLYGLSRDNREEDRKRIFGKLLNLYSEQYFRSQLKHALLHTNFMELAPKVEAAIELTLSRGEEYQASQLLPVLARWKPQAVEALLARFERLPPQTPDPQANVAEALGYIGTGYSRSQLARLTGYSDPAVAEEAQAALERPPALSSAVVLTT